MLVRMSQCSWGAGHLPTAHSDGTDGSATSTPLSANCTSSLSAKLMLLPSRENGGNSNGFVGTILSTCE